MLEFFALACEVFTCCLPAAVGVTGCFPGAAGFAAAGFAVAAGPGLAATAGPAGLAAAAGPGLGFAPPGGAAGCFGPAAGPPLIVDCRYIIY